MIEEDIVNEIKKKSGKVDELPSIGGWHFVYNERHYIYMSGKKAGVIRICIPHLAKSEDYVSEFLSDVINKTNRNVKYVKAVILDCGSISLSYEHKGTDGENVSEIIHHMISALDFAATYLLLTAGAGLVETQKNEKKV